MEDMNDDNHGDSMSHLNERSRIDHLELKEPRNAVLPSLQKPSVKAPKHTLHQQERQEKTPPQSMQEKAKKPRKFQTPLHKTVEVTQDIKCGMEVGLTSPNSNKMVALGTVQKADRGAKASDGKPFEDCVELFIHTVFNQTTLLPCARGNIRKLGNATARIIPWPRQNVRNTDGTPLHSKVSSTINQSLLNTKEIVGKKGSTSKAEMAKYVDVSGASHSMVENKVSSTINQSSLNTKESVGKKGSTSKTEMAKSVDVSGASHSVVENKQRRKISATQYKTGVIEQKLGRSSTEDKGSSASHVTQVEEATGFHITTPRP